MNNIEIKKRFEDIFKNSSKENVLENFAMYAKSLVEVAGDTFLDEILEALFEAFGPMDIDDEEILIQDLDLELQGIQDIAVYFKEFMKRNPMTSLELKELDDEAKMKWNDLKTRIENFFEKAVSNEKKEIYRNLMKEVNI